MSLAVAGVTLLVTLLVAFAVCAWSGRTLARHYQDRLEVIATLAVGGCVLGGLRLLDGTAGGDWGRAALALAASAGLCAGYRRTAPLR